MSAQDGDGRTVDQEQAGAVVFCRRPQGIMLALVHDKHDYCTIPKGKIESGEDPESCAVREVNEEIGLEVTIRKSLGAYPYRQNDPHQGTVNKEVNCYLAEASYKRLPRNPEPDGLVAARWYSISELDGLTLYPEVQDMVEQAISEIR